MKRMLLVLLTLLLAAVPALAASASDEVLSTVQRNLQQAPLGPRDITMQYHQGEVTLSGRVSSMADAVRVEEITRTTPGVYGVTNWLTVDETLLPRQPGVATGLTAETRARMRPASDSQIGAEVHRTLSNPPLNARNVGVNVSGGVVTLTGSRPTFEDVDRILSNVMMLEGVQNVNNQMTINGRPYMDVYNEHAKHTRPTDEFKGGE